MLEAVAAAEATLQARRTAALEEVYSDQPQGGRPGNRPGGRPGPGGGRR